MSIYSTVPIKKPKRNAFNLSHTRTICANIGELRLIARAVEAIPGDTFITGNISKVTLNPIINKFNGELYYETWQFFVSNDMLYETTDSGKFTEILASLQNPQNLLPLPYTQIGAYSNYSYVKQIYGLPKSSVGYIYSTKHFIAYVTRAYIKIVNEWFRDENLEAEYGPNNPFGTDFYLLNYKKDRYTSAFTSTQKGTTIRFNMGSQTLKLKTQVESDLANMFAKSNNSHPNVTLADNNFGGSSTAFYLPSSVSDADMEFANGAISRVIAENLVTDPTGTGITINDLRLYNKLQKWQERNQLCGTRMKEYLLANYGVTPNDETLQRPVLIGHTKVPVVVSEITTNIYAPNYNGSSVVQQGLQNTAGARRGTAEATSSFRYGKWYCKEFGWIITLGALRPRAMYSQGIHKSLIKDNIIDYWNPIFQHLGQQPIKKQELMFTNDSTDSEVWGYQDIYNEMRHLEDCIDDDVLDIMPTYSMCRKFANRPSLDRNFIKVDPSEYDNLFALPHTQAPQAFIDSLNIIKAVRPIAKRSTPTLGA